MRQMLKWIHLSIALMVSWFKPSVCYWGLHGHLWSFTCDLFKAKKRTCLSFFQAYDFQIILHHVHHQSFSNKDCEVIWVPVPNSKVSRGKAFPSATKQLKSTQFWCHLPGDSIRFLSLIRLSSTSHQMLITNASCHLCFWPTCCRFLLFPMTSSNSGCQSQVHIVTCTSYQVATNQRFHDSLPGFG